jgi:divalent metal cation (Fe/Co/Zn/Cd) transporter
MEETVKNFIAMVVATAIWMAGLLILVGVYYLFESGPAIEEVVFIAVDVVFFALGVFLSRKNKRLEAALNFPLLP